MIASESAALDSYQLIARVLGGVQEVDLRCSVLGRSQPSPLVPSAPGWSAHETGRAGAPGATHEGGFDASRLRVVDAGRLLGAAPYALPAASIALFGPSKMGDLMTGVRALSELGVAAIGLDLSPLADTPPYGHEAWRPRTREELAELRGACGAPLWLFGVAGAADAEVAAEAGADAVVVHGALGARMGAAASIELLPEVIDAVGGMVAVLSGGLVRDGIDVLRYLAVGAEAVVVTSDRALPNLEAELRYAMRLTGCAGLEDVGYDILFAPMFGEP